MAWYNASWTYRQACTITGSMIAGTVSSFPCLVSVTSNTLKHSSSGGHVGTTGGLDFLFTLSDGTTKLSHEIELYEPHSGSFISWVNIPSLTVSSNQTVYMYYGNASASDQQSVTATWDSNYYAVLHLKENPTSTAPQMKDSTSKAHHGSISGSFSSSDSISTIIGKGLNSDGGAGDYIILPDHADYDSLTHTISCWVNPNVTINNTTPRTELFSRVCDSIWILWNTAQTLGKLDIYTRCDGPGAQSSTTSWNAGTWYKIDVTESSTGFVNLYINGVKQGSGQYSTNFIGSNPWTIGDSDYGNAFNGKLDEIRFSNIDRSSGWILTEYYNQSSPSTFMLFGSEETDTVVVSQIITNSIFFVGD